MGDRPNSGITFDDIERKRTGYRVKANVFLQEIDQFGRAGRQVHKLEGWISLTTSLNLQGQGAAHIVFSNNFDHLFSKRYVRRFGQGDNATQDETTTKAYLTDILSRTAGTTRYLNPTRRPSFYAPGQEGKRLHDLSYIETLRDLTANATGAIGQDNLPGDAVALGLLQRVFVDVIGRDGRAYACFSGLLSSVLDNKNPGENPTITLVCKDNWRLFQLTEVIMKEGQGFNLLDETLAFDSQNEIGFHNYYQSSIFDGMNGIDVIKNLVKIVQATFCSKSYVIQKLQAVTSVVGIDLTGIKGLLSKVEDDFFYLDRFFNLDDNADLIANFDGVTPLRVVKPTIALDDVTIRGVHYAAGAAVPGKEPGVGIEEGDLVAQLEGELLIDRSINEGVQAEVYRRVIERVLQPFQAQRSRGDAILRKVAEATMYEIFFDGNGNLIYQIPRRNNYPGEYDPAFSTNLTLSGFDLTPANTDNVDVTITLSNPATKFVKRTPTYDFGKVGDWDYSPPGEDLPMKGHGLNYIITDLSSKGWQLMLSEEPIVTNVRTPSGFDYVKFGEVITTRFLTGITRLEDVKHLQRRFGLRTMETQQIFLPRFNTNDSKFVHNRSVDDAYALAVMEQMNASASSGQIVLTIRPDLELGKNILVLERQRLYEVLGVTHVIKQGNESETTLTLGFGHDLGERISNPWVSVRDSLITQSPATSDVGAVSPTGADLDPSQPKLEAGDETVAVAKDGPIILPVGRAGLQKNYGLIRGAENPKANGTKDFIPRANGTVLLTNGFEANHIVTIDVTVGSTRAMVKVHNKLAGIFKSVFADLAADFRRRPEFANKVLNIGQAFFPRFTAYNSNLALSTHSWGVAVDVYLLNRGETRPVYHLGQRFEANDLLVPYFTKYKFVWGGTFRKRDDIHFQFCKVASSDIIQAPVVAEE